MQNGLNNPGPFTIFLVFSAGLLTSLGPCSLSLLPITIAYIGGTEKNKFKLISFSGGVVFSFVALGAASGFLGRIYGQIPTYYTSIVALIAIIMGLNLLGILKFQFPNGPDMKIISDMANLKLDIFNTRFLKIIIQIQFDNKFNKTRETKNIPLKVGII